MGKLTDRVLFHRLSVYANESWDEHEFSFSTLIEMMRHVHHVFALWQ